MVCAPCLSEVGVGTESDVHLLEANGPSMVEAKMVAQSRLLILRSAGEKEVENQHR